MFKADWVVYAPELKINMYSMLQRQRCHRQLRVSTLTTVLLWCGKQLPASRLELMTYICDISRFTSSVEPYGYEYA